MYLQIYKKDDNLEDRLIYENQCQKQVIDFEINSKFNIENKKYLVLETVKRFRHSDFDNDLQISLLQVFTKEV